MVIFHSYVSLPEGTLITCREEVFRSFKAFLFGFNMRQSKTAVGERLYLSMINTKQA